jgi:hypothetical protein
VTFGNPCMHMMDGHVPKKCMHPVREVLDPVREVLV